MGDGGEEAWRLASKFVSTLSRSTPREVHRRCVGEYNKSSTFLAGDDNRRTAQLSPDIEMVHDDHHDASNRCPSCKCHDGHRDG